MAIALVSGQNVSNNGTSSATTAHFNSTVTAGNAIAVGVTTNTASRGATSVTDSNSNTFVKVGTSYQANTNTIELWLCLNCTSSGSPNQTLTATGTSGDSISLIGQEISGLPTSNAFDKQANISTSSGTSLTTGSVTTASANEILIAIGAQNNTNRPYTAGTGYTMIAQIAAAAGIAMEYELETSTGSYSAGMTIDTAQPFELALFTLSSTAIGAVSHKNLLLVGVG